MSIEGLDGVGEVEVARRVFLEYDVDGAAHRGAAKLGRDDALVDLNPLDHTDGDVVDVDKIGVIVHGRFVDKEANAFTLEATHGKA